MCAEEINLRHNTIRQPRNERFEIKHVPSVRQCNPSNLPYLRSLIFTIGRCPQELLFVIRSQYPTSGPTNVLHPSTHTPTARYLCCVLLPLSLYILSLHSLVVVGLLIYLLRRAYYVNYNFTKYWISSHAPPVSFSPSRSITRSLCLSFNVPPYDFVDPPVVLREIYLSNLFRITLRI